MFRKGDTPWNKGLGRVARVCTVCSQQYIKQPWRTYKQWETSKFCSRNCMGLATRGSNNHYKGSLLGVKNGMWKGDNVGYIALHMWVKRRLGKAWKCLQCDGTTGSKKYDWANISHQYRRDITDWTQLCKKCHFKYDNQDKRERDYHGRFI